MKAADMHCDTIAEIHDLRAKGKVVSILHNDLQIDLEKMEAGDYGLQNFALFVSLGREKRPFEYAMALLDTFYMEMEAHPDRIGVVRSYRDIEKNWAAGKMSALLTIEEGGVCEGNLSYLRDFYRLGVRMMTLTWNYANELGWPNVLNLEGSATVGYADTEHGLTDTGIAFVEEMDRLGMIVDVSHLSDAGFWDVVKYGKRPFVASHSNCRALVPGCPRDLTDEMIRAIAERGGVIGINYCIDFLHSPDEWKAGETHVSRVSDMVCHMKHMKKVGGIGCIGLGSDFDGIGGVQELKTAADLPLLEEEMRRQGFTEAEIEAVFHGNVLRVYRDVLK